MFGAFIKSLMDAMAAVARGMREGMIRRTGRAPDLDDVPPDKYIFDRYFSDMCDQCRELEEEGAYILLHPDGKIEGDTSVIPPIHYNCDCAMYNERTGNYAFNVAGSYQGHLFN